MAYGRRRTNHAAEERRERERAKEARIEKGQADFREFMKSYRQIPLKGDAAQAAWKHPEARSFTLGELSDGSTIKAIVREDAEGNLFLQELSFPGWAFFRLVPRYHTLRHGEEFAGRDAKRRRLKKQVARKTRTRNPKRSTVRRGHGSIPSRRKRENTMAGMPKRRARRTGRRRTSRDWRGDDARHAKASKKGWKSHAKPGWKPKRRKTRRDASAAYGRDWKGAHIRHEQAASRGWRTTAKRGWKPKRPTWAGSHESTRGGRKEWAKLSKAERRRRNMITRRYKALAPKRHKRHHGARARARSR